MTSDLRLALLTVREAIDEVISGSDDDGGSPQSLQGLPEIAPYPTRAAALSFIAAKNRRGAERLDRNTKLAREVFKPMALNGSFLRMINLGRETEDPTEVSMFVDHMKMLERIAVQTFEEKVGMASVLSLLLSDFWNSPIGLPTFSSEALVSFLALLEVHPNEDLFKVSGRIFNEIEIERRSQQSVRAAMGSLLEKHCQAIVDASPRLVRVLLLPSLPHGMVLDGPGLFLTWLSVWVASAHRNGIGSALEGAICNCGSCEVVKKLIKICRDHTIDPMKLGVDKMLDGATDPDSEMIIAATIMSAETPWEVKVGEGTVTSVRVVLRQLRSISVKRDVSNIDKPNNGALDVVTPVNAARLLIWSLYEAAERRVELGSVVKLRNSALLSSAYLPLDESPLSEITDSLVELCNMMTGQTEPDERFDQAYYYQLLAAAAVAEATLSGSVALNIFSPVRFDSLIPAVPRADLATKLREGVTDVLRHRKELINNRTALDFRSHRFTELDSLRTSALAGLMEATPCSGIKKLLEMADFRLERGSALGLRI